MKLSEAIEEIASWYEPGAITWCSRLTPDPWIAAIEELERTLVTNDNEVIQAAADKYVEKIKAIVERFKKESKGSIQISPLEACITDPMKVIDAKAASEKACVVCGASKNLVLARGISKRIVPICELCKPEYARQRKEYEAKERMRQSSFGLSAS